MEANTLSDTGTVKALGVFKTRTPNSAAACWSIESMPVPHLEMTRSAGAQAAITRAL